MIPVQVAGVSTNIGFLERLIAHKSFKDGDVHTGFIEVWVGFMMSLDTWAS